MKKQSSLFPALLFFGISLCFLLPLLGCNDPKKPSDSHFTSAINKTLSVHGKACISGFNQFPIDIAKSQMSWNKTDLDRLSALEAVGLVKSADMMAVVQGQGNQDRPVTRYDLTDSGKKYLEQIPGVFIGSQVGFCYAQETVDSIVKWTEPSTAGGFSMTIVTYTYRLKDVADWSKNDRIASQYPEIKREFDGEKTQQRALGMQLTNKGWESN